MRVLVLGGTQFVGRHIVEAMLAAGYAVSILTRGRTPDDLPASVERLRGDRDAPDAGLTQLAGRSWDACVDVSGYTPRQVRPSAELLQDRIERYVFISAVSIYGDPTLRPVVETHPLLPPAAEDVTEIDSSTYGRLKVTCEQIVQEVYDDRGACLRPQIVAGPHDPSGRFTYWVDRAAQGGEMLAPGDGSDHLQVIDARDLARFAVKVIEDRLSGSFNMAGPRLTWAEFMRVLGADDPVWVSAEVIRESGLNEWQLPLYRQEMGARSGLMDVSSERSQAAGLTLTDTAATVRDTRAWSQGKTLPLLLSPEREAELIRAATER